MQSKLFALTPLRKWLIVTVACAAVAAFAGSAGQMLVLLVLWLCGPGYIAERLILRGQLTLLLRFALWCGIGWSLVALLYQWATFASLQLSTPTLQLLTVALACVCAALAWQEAADDRAEIERDWALLMLFIVFAVTVWTRFRQIADLALPAWVDSVHHALMVNVAAERGQAPLSLQPYMPVEDLPYHWGYHVLIAAIRQLSGLATPQLLLWSGQILSAFLVVSGAALALYFWRRPAVVPVAALIIGLISFLPAYYVAWGRYTQLSGLLMLPAVAISWGNGLRTRDRQWWIMAAIGLAGLSLVHFRVLIFALALLAVMTVIGLAERAHTLPRHLLEPLACGIAAMLLSLPWLLLIGRRTLLPAVERPQNLIIEGNYNALSEGLLWFGQGRNLVALALLAAGWGLYRRSRTALICVLWVALIFGLANPWLFNYVLPAAGLLLAIWAIGARNWLLIGAGTVLMLLNPWFFSLPSIYLINNDSVIITLFLPLAILISGGAAALFGWLQQASGQPRVMAVLTSALVIGLSLWGARGTQMIVTDATIIAEQADVEAIAWVAQNTPADARFLINATGWIPGAERGVDGGWWLLTLAGRWMSTPPVLFTYGPLDDVRATQERNRIVATFQPGQEQAILDLIDRDGIDYLYFGPRSAPNGPLRPEYFATNSRFNEVYNQTGVRIFAVLEKAEALGKETDPGP
jgi:hypothetical protein